MAMNVQNKDANLSLERLLASGVLAKMIENFKGCTIQSTISNSAHIDSNERVDKINDSEEPVGARNWLRKDITEQVDQINDSDKQVDAIIYISNKQVDAIGDSKQLVVDWSNPKSDPKVAIHTTNEISTTHTTNRISQKLLINPTIQVVIGLINPIVTAGVVGTQDIFKPAPDGYLAGKRPGHGAQVRAYLLDSWEGKRHRKGRHQANGRFFFLNELQIEIVKPKFHSYLYLPSALQGPRYCQSKAPR